jgi:hypothetical protein
MVQHSTHAEQGRPSTYTCVYIYITSRRERKEKMVLLLSEATDCTLGCCVGGYYFSLYFKTKI